MAAAKQAITSRRGAPVVVPHAAAEHARRQRIVPSLLDDVGSGRVLGLLALQNLQSRVH